MTDPPRQRRSVRALLSLVGGFALFAGHDPLGWGWIGLVALVPLLLLARDCAGDARPARAGFGWGTLAGFAGFLPLLWWIQYVELVALPLLPLTQAPFVGAFVAVVARWGDRAGRGVVAVALWVALEWVRSQFPFDSGFPWGLLGYTQATGGPLLEAARTVGVFGVSALLAATAVALEAALHRGARAWGALAAARPQRLQPLPQGEAVGRAITAPLGLVLGLVALGILLQGEPPEPTGETLDIAAVQGFDDVSGPRGERSSAQVIAESYEDATIALAEGPDGPPELTVWPESAQQAAALSDDPGAAPLRASLERSLDALEGRPLVTGMREDGPTDDTFYNTLRSFDEGQPQQRYVKRDLVPFGEFIPYRPLFEWYPALDRVGSDAIPGDEPGVFDIRGTPVGGVICFEAIYPATVRDTVDAGAQVLITATNNSIFGPTAASDQHIATSQLRAVETGRWVVHAALTGRSALIAPDGMVHERTGLFTQDLIRADVPLVEGTTVAGRIGELVAWVAAAASTGAVGWLGLEALRRRTGSGPSP